MNATNLQPDVTSARVPVGARAPSCAEELLFAKVLVNDRIDLTVAAPDPVRFDQDAAQLDACFRICRRLWESVDLPAARRMMAGLRHALVLGEADRAEFKNVRAKFKQLRFAYANFDRRHRYPRLFDQLTAIMGHLQDDLRHHRRDAIRRRATMVRVLLSRLAYRLIRREIDGFRVATPVSFRDHVRHEIGFVRDCLAQPSMTGSAFHEVRKIVSRQASFYVSLATLYPSTAHERMFRYLATINGLMGRMHDELVEKKLLGTQDYHADRFELPGEIAQRLHLLVGLYPD